jgi:arylsulfatase A-like enzyme
MNVPMIAYCPGSIASGIDTSLVDMTDFFPTFAEIAGASKTPYEPLDGTTFYDNLRGSFLLPNKEAKCIVTGREITREN